MTVIVSMECSNGLLRRYDTDSTFHYKRRPTHMGLLTDGMERLDVVRTFRSMPRSACAVMRDLPLLLEI